jgi:exodeoxyribonuclease-1
MSFLFYDLETSGLQAHFDIPLQAAFVQTDAVNRIQREVTLRSRLPAHVVPSPEALLVTGVTPAMLEDQPLSHLEMMDEIMQLMSDSQPCIVVGYNNLRFDDEVIRQSFFQTLLPPYAGSMTGHGRADVLVMLRAVIMLEPDAVVVPRSPDGKPLLKLGEVCRANGIGLREDAAHDALADVLATRDLFRLLLDRAPVTMATMLANAKKSGPNSLMAGDEPVILGGISRLVPVAPFIGSPTNPNARTVIDLTEDPAGLVDLQAPELLALIRTGRSPIRQVKTNAQPILFGWDQAAQALVEPLPLSVYRTRARALWDHPTFTRQLALALEGRYADREPSPWVDEQLYSGGFVSNADAAACERWHQLPWALRASFAAQHIKDPRLRSLAIRQVFLNAPEALSLEAQHRGQTWLHHRLTTTDEVPWMTIPKALARCEQLAATVEVTARPLLTRIEHWLLAQGGRFKPGGPFRSR